jgi:hypothetical protein
VARKKCEPAFGVNVQMLSNTLKAFTFSPPKRRTTLIELLAFVQKRVEAYFFIDFFVLFYQEKRTNKTIQ